MSTDSPARAYRALLTRKNLLLACAFLIWLLFLLRATQVFTPGSAHVTMFNSDSAIVVLMANENRPATVYNTYYYGQDRFGAWPFLIAQVIHRATGYHWTNRALFIIQTIWLFIGALLFATMSRCVDVRVGLLFLLPLCLHVTARENLFDLSQPYAWQTTALIFSWWSLRRFCEYCFGLVESNRQKANRLFQNSRYSWTQILRAFGLLFAPLREKAVSRKGAKEKLKTQRSAGDFETISKRIAWGALTFWFALLAVLSSIVSGPVLFFLLVLEVLRSIYKLGGEQDFKKLGKRFLQVALPVAAAVAVEFLLRVNYHHYSRKHFGIDNKTEAHLDRGHLIENLINQWTRFSNSPWWLLSLLPLLLLAVLGARYIYLLKGNKEKFSSSLRTLFLEDNAILVIGTFAIGLINFIITVLVSHIRINDYSERYLTLSYLFISFSGLLTLLLLAGRTKRHSRSLQSALAVAGLVFLLFKFPPAVINPFYTRLKETALTLSQKASGSVLLGGYWETYVFAALDPNGSIVPLPAEGESLRTPWTVEALKKADQVIIEHRPPSLGGPEAPAPYLVQYGIPLRLVTPGWYVNGEYNFSVYKNEAGQP